jgi:hypothetical protein
MESKDNKSLLTAYRIQPLLTAKKRVKKGFMEIPKVEDSSEIKMKLIYIHKDNYI